MTPPLLVFLDPYGLGIPFEQFVGDVLGRSGRAGWGRTRITEVIFHFSLNGLSRMGGFLDKDYTAPDDDEQQVRLLFDDHDDADQDESEEAAARLERQLGPQAQALGSMDAFLGGDWWRAVKRSPSTSDWREEVLHRWIELVGKGTKNQWSAISVPVADRWGGPASTILEAV